PWMITWAHVFRSGSGGTTGGMSAEGWPDATHIGVVGGHGEWLSPGRSPRWTYFPASVRRLRPQSKRRSGSVAMWRSCSRGCHARLAPQVPAASVDENDSH